MNDFATNLGIIGLGSFIMFLAFSLVMSIRAAFKTGDMHSRDSDEKTKEKIKRELIVGREYLVKDADAKWFQGIYGGLNLDGWRRFVNLDTGHGVSIKAKTAENLFRDGDVKWVYTQTPLPERKINHD